MKKFTLYILTAFGLMGLATSCNDFGDVNNDPMNLNPGVVDYKMEFTQVEAQICGSDWDVWRNGCIYTANMIQHTASVDWAYGVFYTWNDQYSGAYWGGFYSGGRAAIRNIIDVMNNWEGDPAYTNEYQMCRILKAYMFQNMTDLYGDVPYSEAGQGYSTNPIPYPKYDTQEAIYDDLLKELDEAQAALSTSAGNTIGAADVIYGGDAAKWKKFANSLMLRVAMRLTKVAPDKAKTWVAKAVSNGLFVSNDDNAIVRHTNGSPSDDSAEPYGKVFSSLDTQAFYISETFINILQDDPRLSLAPRDIVARAIDNEMKNRGDDHVYLDVTHKDPEETKKHFPNIYEKCLGLGIDITRDYIPVAPAAHYLCGGIKVDLDARSSINRLYAVGECACTGLHGGNRLASNSLIEAVVYADAAAKHSLKVIDNFSYQENIPEWNDEGTQSPEEMVLITQSVKEVGQIMSTYVGIVRSDLRLKRAWDRLDILYEETESLFKRSKASKEICELRNMINTGYLVMRQAMDRKESRGLHYTIDYPHTDNTPQMK